MKKNTLYYDGQCPMCSIEMARLGKHTCDQLDLIDIHSLDKPPIDKALLLKQLHLHTEKGFITGLDANIFAWQHTPWARLWRCLQWPIINPIANFLYNRWAQWRFRRRYGSKHDQGNSL